MAVKVPVPSRGVAFLLSVGLLLAGVWLANVTNGMYSSQAPRNWLFYVLKSSAYGLFLLAAMPWVVRRLAHVGEGTFPLYLWMLVFLIMWAVILFFTWL